MTNGRTAAMSRGAGFLAEQKSAVRVIRPAMWCRRATMMMTRTVSYLIGLGVFSAVDAERRSERVEHATRDEARHANQLQLLVAVPDLDWIDSRGLRADAGVAARRKP